MTTGATTVDFSKLIRGPLQRCPKCGEDTFGVLSVHAHDYRRRCRRAECWHTSDALPLPALHKKIIYLDQFAISEMAKVQDAELKRNFNRSVARCWPGILEKLRLLVGAQMIVCPESECHFHESLVMASGYKGLKALYEGMGGGVRFEPPREIQTRQICRALRRWLDNKSVSAMTVTDATTGEINAWQDIIRVSLNIDWSSMIPALRQVRDAVDQSLCTVFQQWRGDQQWTFDDWVREETIGVGKGLITSFQNAFDSLDQQSDNTDAFLRYTHHPMHRIVRDLREGGVPPQKELETLCEFFQSKEFSELPSVKISALMFAAIARQVAQQGRANPPTRGFNTDVSAISAFLPYCDAMFIDKGCWTILTQNPDRDLLGFQTRLFSIASTDAFTDFLDEIAGAVTPALRGALVEVYGNDFVNRLASVFGTR